MSAGEILSSAFVFWALTALAAIMPLTLFRYETTGKDTIEYFLYYIAYVTVGTIGILVVKFLLPGRLLLAPCYPIISSLVLMLLPFRADRKTSLAMLLNAYIIGFIMDIRPLLTI